MRRLLILVLFFTIHPAVCLSAGVDDLLPIDDAYKVSVSIQQPGILNIDIKIADDYYLYRGRMKLSALDGAELGTPIMPPGIKEHDEYFGDVEIYRGLVHLKVPYMVKHGSSRLRVKVGYQGCHEVRPKLCYPPTTKIFILTVPHASTNGGAREGESAAELPGHTSTTRGTAYDGSVRAQMIFKAGEAALSSGKWSKAIGLYEKAITLDPRFAEAQREYVIHKRFEPIHDLIEANGGITQEVRNKTPEALDEKDRISRHLIKQYEQKIHDHPDNAVYPWIIAVLHDMSDVDVQKKYCEKAVSIDDNFARGWTCLAHIAMLKGNLKDAERYIKHASRLLPDDASIASKYADILSLDTRLHRHAFAELIKRFPGSRKIARARVNSAMSKTSAERMPSTLDSLRMLPPSASRLVSGYAADNLYEYYIHHDLNKAYLLSANMLSGDHEPDKKWFERHRFMKVLLAAERDLTNNDVDSALKNISSISDVVKHGSAEEINKWTLIKARALAAVGRIRSAEKILQRRFINQPSDPVLKALFRYGNRLGKKNSDVDNELWRILEKNSKAAHPFSLKKLDGSKYISLSDYLGKVIIIDFWYPTCIPCRESSPYLQKVARKFGGKGLSVLAINSIEDQQPMAIDYLRRNEFDFIGLAGNRDFAMKVYNVESFPTTLFIGPKGKILFKMHVHDNATLRSAETAVDYMLTHARS